MKRLLFLSLLVSSIATAQVTLLSKNGQPVLTDVQIKEKYAQFLATHPKHKDNLATDPYKDLICRHIVSNLIYAEAVLMQRKNLKPTPMDIWEAQNAKYFGAADDVTEEEVLKGIMFFNQLIKPKLLENNPDIKKAMKNLASGAIQEQYHAMSEQAKARGGTLSEAPTEHDLREFVAFSIAMEQQGPKMEKIKKEVLKANIEGDFQFHHLALHKVFTEMCSREEKVFIKHSWQR